LCFGVSDLSADWQKAQINPNSRKSIAAKRIARDAGGARAGAQMMTNASSGVKRR
jgi:hypothetical protein